MVKFCDRCAEAIGQDDGNIAHGEKCDVCDRVETSGIGCVILLIKIGLVLLCGYYLLKQL